MKIIDIGMAQKHAQIIVELRTELDEFLKYYGFTSEGTEISQIGSFLCGCGFVTCRDGAYHKLNICREHRMPQILAEDKAHMMRCGTFNADTWTQYLSMCGYREDESWKDPYLRYVKIEEREHDKTLG